MKTTYDSSENYELISGIVSAIPQRLVKFFDSLIVARNTLNAAKEIAVLNRIAAEERNSPVMMKWLEIFRDVYVAHCLDLEKTGDDQPKKNTFTTFERSFENLAFLPDYWFANPTLLKPALRDNADAIRFSLERFLYSMHGGRAWCALDWERDKYTFRDVCEPKQSERPLLKLASLYLSAAAIVRGELGLYVGPRQDMLLPFTGIVSAKDVKTPLLKYFHVDRYTQLSFIRARETSPSKDADAQGDYARFEPDWMALSALTEFIIEDKNARASRTTATRVGLEEIGRCLKDLSKINALGDDPECVDAISVIQRDFDEVGLTHLKEAPFKELLAGIGVTEHLIPPAYYLKKLRIDSAKKFWQEVEPIIDELLARFDKIHFETVEKYTERDIATRYSEPLNSQCVFLMNALTYGHIDELPGHLYGERLATAVKKCIIGGKLELQYGAISDLFFERDLPEKLGVNAIAENRYSAMPRTWLFADKDNDSFRAWFLETLTDLAAATFAPEKEETPTRRGGRQRDTEKNPLVPRDYRTVNLKKIAEQADRLWNIYFSDTDGCMTRWVISIRKAGKTLDKMHREHKTKADKFSNGYTFSCSEDTNYELRKLLAHEKSQLPREYQTLSDQELAEHFAKHESFTIFDIRPMEDRHLVMFCLLTRLMVETADRCPGLWDEKDNLTAFFTHMLCATLPRLDLPFPWHIGLFTDGYLRIGRLKDSQGNNLDRILAHRYNDQAERQLMLIFLARYLRSAENALKTLQCIIEKPAMRTYFGRERLDFLKRHFGGEA
ncbi:MAG: hypothetical protein J5806_02930 [Lentisphaeria bacterium]|nr:hypothetical protein [Lentisphaeria bacterium]